jgi:hypothetical protein
MRLLWTRDGDSIAAIVLSLVESFVGELYQEIDSVGGFQERCDANRNGDYVREFTFSLQVELFEASANLVGADASLLQPTFGQDNDKFFASITTGQVFGTHNAKKRLADQAESIVPRGVPKFVVIALEMVDIEHHHRERTLPTAGAMELAFESFLHVAAVVEAR